MVDISQIFSNNSGNLSQDEFLQMLSLLNSDIQSFQEGGETPPSEGPTYQTTTYNGQEWAVFGDRMVPLDVIEGGGTPYNDGTYTQPQYTIGATDRTAVPTAPQAPLPPAPAPPVLDTPESNDFSQYKSFGQAFSAARASLGPRGEFIWKGKVYNTITKEDLGGQGTSSGRAATSRQAVPSSPTPTIPTNPPVPDTPQSRQEAQVRGQNLKVEYLKRRKQQQDIAEQRRLVNKLRLENDAQREQELGWRPFGVSEAEKQQRDIIRLRGQIARQKLAEGMYEDGGQIPMFDVGGELIEVIDTITGQPTKVSKTDIENNPTRYRTLGTPTQAGMANTLGLNLPGITNTTPNAVNPTVNVYDPTTGQTSQQDYQDGMQLASNLGYTSGLDSKNKPFTIDNVGDDTYLPSSVVSALGSDNSQAYRANQALQDKLKQQDLAMNLFNTATGNTDYSVEDALYKVGESLAYRPLEGDFLNADGEVNETTMGVAKGFNAAKGILAGGKALIGGARNVMTGYANQKRNDLIEEEYLRRQMLARKNQNLTFAEDGTTIPFFNDGGYLRYLQDGTEQMYSNMGPQDPRMQMSPEQEMTGEYIQQQPIQAGVVPNAEVERGEFIQTPDGQTQQVEGRTHEEGGERVALEGGSKVISDNLKLGAKNAKLINREYDLKVKAGDTFATAIDKYSKKIGLKELNELQQELFNKVKKDSKTKDEAASELNSQYLSEKINNIEQKKGMIENFRSEFTDFVYQLQQDSKTPRLEEDSEKKNSDVANPPVSSEDVSTALQMADTPMMRNGGQIPSYEEGGSPTITREQFIQLANALGITEEDLKDNSKFPQPKSGGDVIDYNVGLSQTEGLTAKSLYEYLAKRSPIPGVPKTYDAFKTSRFKDTRFGGRDVFAEVDKDYKPQTAQERGRRGPNTSLTKGDNPTTIRERGQSGTNWSSTNLNPLASDVKGPQAFTQTGAGVNTSGRVTDETLPTVNEFLYKHFPGVRKYFNTETDRHGRQINPVINDVKGYQTYFDTELFPALSKWGRDNIKNASERDSWYNAIDQFRFDDKGEGTRQIDGIFGDYTVDKSPISWKFVTPEEKSKLDELGVSQTSDIFDDKGVIKEEFNFLSPESVERLSKTKDYEGLDLYIDVLDPVEEEEEVNNDQSPTTPYNPALPKTYRRPVLPDMSTEPPSPMEAHMKAEHRYNTIDPIRLSPENQLTEIYRQNDAAMGQIEGLTDTQRAAAISNLTANTQNAASTAISNVQAQNAQTQLQVDQFNNQVLNREEDMRVADAQAYEQLQFTAKAKADYDRLDYLEKARENRIKRFNYLTKDRQIHDMVENFKVGPDGSIQFDVTSGNQLYNYLISTGKTPQEAAEEVRKQTERINKDAVGNVKGSTTTTSVVTKPAK